MAKRDGFTLIELMIVVAIISVLATIVFPTYSEMVARSREATTKGNLGAIRSALSIYYGDNEGKYPVDAGDLGSLTASQKYLEAFPDALLPKMSNSSGHGIQSTVVNALADGGGWYYNNAGEGDPNWGQILVNCSHQDAKGNTWNAE